MLRHYGYSDVTQSENVLGQKIRHETEFEYF